MVPAGGYLVLFANNPDLTSGLHTGFNLSQDGDAVYLYSGFGTVLVDSIEFGAQLPDLSIGRLGSGEWALNTVTAGAVNMAAATGPANALVINEWLAIGQTPFPDDFIELYNTSPLPVALGGLYLTDTPLGNPDLHRIPDLTYIAGLGYRALIADGDQDAGSLHVDFRLKCNLTRIEA